MLSIPSLDVNLAFTQIMESIPYPAHIRGVSVQEERNLYFNWRGDDFKITAYSREDGSFGWSLYEVDGRLLVGSNKALLMAALCGAKEGLSE